jgi:hypothetical protein
MPSESDWASASLGSVSVGVVCLICFSQLHFSGAVPEIHSPGGAGRLKTIVEVMAQA